MATKNSLNNKSQELTLDPGASGDSFLQFDINATGEFRIGVDDDAADTFKISQGDALGANDTFIMTAAGENTMPLQVAFSAYLGTTDTDVTGNGTYFQLGSGNALTEIFDQNSDFNTNGTFTASVDGRYYFATGSLVQQCATATSSLIQINTSNRAYDGNHMDPSSGVAVGGELGLNMTVFADMDAADTCVSRVQYNGVGADTSDVAGQATDPLTWFSGYLAC